MVSKCSRLQVLQLCQYVADAPLLERIREMGKKSNISKVILVRSYSTPQILEVDILILTYYTMEDDFPDMQFIF